MPATLELPEIELARPQTPEGGFEVSSGLWLPNSAQEETKGHTPNGNDIPAAIITDCWDANAAGRQITRLASLTGIHAELIPLDGDFDDGNNDLRGAFELIDQLESATTPGNFPQRELVLLVNVAPRGDDVREKWPNGTPFCYFRTKSGHHVFSTFEGRTLSLARDLGEVNEVALFDIPEVTKHWVKLGRISEQEAQDIIDTQFRSKEFLPLVAYCILNGISLPHTIRSLEDRPEAWGHIGAMDNFGNLKFAAFASDLNYRPGNTLRIRGEGGGGEELITCFERLKAVPTGYLGLTIGSSGLPGKKFPELVEGKGNAAKRTGLGLGDNILSRIIDAEVITA